MRIINVKEKKRREKVRVKKLGNYTVVNILPYSYFFLI